MSKLTTIVLDTVENGVVYKGDRHMFLGRAGEKERWIDTHRNDVSFEFRGRQLTVTAETEYLAGKDLLGFAQKG